MRGDFGPEWEIRMVRENLALAIACWTAVQQGQITPALLPAGRAALVSSAGQRAEVFNPLPPMNRAELARCSSNQVRCAFAFSAMQVHRTLEAVCPGSPLARTWGRLLSAVPRPARRSNRPRLQYGAKPSDLEFGSGG